MKTKRSLESSDVLYLIPEKTRKKNFICNNTVILLLTIVLILLCLGAFLIVHYKTDCVKFLLSIIEDDCKSTPSCSGISDLEKFDCYPDAPVSKTQCQNRGCCYAVPQENNSFNFPPLSTPYCFYPKNYVGYSIINVYEDENRIRATLRRNGSSGFPRDVQNLVLVISFIDDCTLRIKITDANSSRFEVPIPLYYQTKQVKERCYNVHLDSNSGSLSVTRKSTGTVIFNTNLSRLVYSDQFLQISSNLPSRYVYGIGEHYGGFLRNVNWTRFTLMNSDLAPIPNHSLYGSQPFYMALELDGRASGVFLFNSNPMDVILQPTPAITFRPIGGILEFFVMLGPTPENVVQQFTGIVGRTLMPPYWSLGFHLCRFGYKTLNKTKEVVQRTINASIPLDVQWNDIDYMDSYKDFTYDKVNFEGLPEFVDELHEKGMHYVIMTDPGISNSEKPGAYPPYEEGIDEDLFIKNSNGSIFVGKVWTDGQTVFPDFSHPAAASYWTRQFNRFYDEVKFDGVWIDMNEPSNFYNGGVDGCPSSSLENPPYVPGDIPLRTKTICMSAKHYYTTHYNEHNIYGYREAAATNHALKSIRKKRPFIISRATFSGQGVHSGHWSGDISSNWEDMRYTIPSMLNFNMYGISMIGSDICGFNYNTTVELCARWQALGAFYPFSRNHNERITIEQDPVALGPVVIEATRNSLNIRYALLPYLYTLFYRSHAFGDTVVRPLFFEFANDINTYDIDEQFLWGSGMMIIPALYSNVSHVSAYFPKGLWYNTSLQLINSTGQTISVSAPINNIYIAVRGGSILPFQLPALTTTAGHKNPLMLLVVLNESKEAFGELYWDDGDSLDTYENGNYNLIQFKVKSSNLVSSVLKKGYHIHMNLSAVEVVGLKKAPGDVFVNGRRCRFASSKDIKYTTIDDEEQDMSWKKIMFGLGNIYLKFHFNEETCVTSYFHEVLIIATTDVSLLHPLSINWAN